MDANTLQVFNEIMKSSGPKTILTQLVIQYAKTGNVEGLQNLHTQNPCISIATNGVNGVQIAENQPVMPLLKNLICSSALTSGKINVIDWCITTYNIDVTELLIQTFKNGLSLINSQHEENIVRTWLCANCAGGISFEHVFKAIYMEMGSSDSFQAERFRILFQLYPEAKELCVTWIQRFEDHTIDLSGFRTSDLALGNVFLALTTKNA